MNKGIARLPYYEYTKGKVPKLKKYWNTKVSKFRKELKRQGIEHKESLVYIWDDHYPIPVLVFEYDIPGGKNEFKL